jgi:Tfp pilus assembly protein PilF
MSFQKAGVVLVLTGVAIGAAGTWIATRPVQPGRPERPIIPAPLAAPELGVAAHLQRLREADAIADPMQRCVGMPLPAEWKWPPAMIEAFCADHTTPRSSSQAVWNQIRDDKGAELDTHYEELTDNYYADRIPEGTYWLDFYDKFSYQDSGTTEAIDAWLAQSPHSAHAHAAAAIHHASVAWGYRGSAFYKDIPPENIAKMKAEVALAEKASQQAIEVDPRSLPAYAVLVDVAMIGGSAEAAAQAFEAGLRQRPDSYHLRLKRMLARQPKWGGSQAELDALAEQAQRYAASNPRLPALLTEAKANRAYEACPEDGQACAGAEQYFLAFEHGPSWQHFGWAVDTLQDNSLWMRSVEVATQELRFEPENTQARRNRARALVNLKQDEWALAEYERMLAADGDNASLLSNYAWALRRMNRFEQAEAPMKRLVAADPQNRDARRQLAQLYLYRLRRLEDARPVIDDMLQADPTDGGAWLLRVDWLQNRNAGDAEIVEAARRFVEHADPDDEEQGNALPKVRAWLANRGGAG